jgi:hypothetical protein
MENPKSQIKIYEYCIMNSGYNPILFDPVKTSQNQAQSQQPPFYFGGSFVPSDLGYIPKITPIVTDRKRIVIKQTKKR